MADQKISQLTNKSPLAGTELVEIVDDPGGTPASKKTTAQDIADLAAGGVDIATTFEMFDDFISGLLTTGNVGDLGWRVTLTGDGGVSKQSNAGGIGELNLHFGNGSGTAVLFINPDTANTQIDGGNYNGLKGGEVLEIRAKILSENIKFRMGFGNGTANGSRPSRGTYLELDTSLSANMRGVFDNDSATTTTAGTAVTDGYHNFKITINVGATEAEFFYDGVSMGTLALSGTRLTDSQGVFINGEYSGTNGKSITIDYVKLTTPVARS